ncbi:MAG TPA: RNA 3'-terminal phosphate cyclase [Gemmataceae bacterium]
MIEIDGSEGEGGGQILRSSLALALLTGQAFHLKHIRAGRAKPGLQPQHLTGVRAAAVIGQARIRGASLGSTDLTFEPGEVVAGNYHFDIKTAGATGLLLHTLYLPLALRGQGPSKLTLVGGTHVLASPCYHFLDVTWRAYLDLMGLPLKLRLLRTGFYPRGGGMIQVEIPSCERLHALHLPERGRVKVHGFSAVAGLSEDIARRQAKRAVHRLARLTSPDRFPLQQWEGGTGSVLAVVVETTPAPALFFGLGARGKPADKVADEAVNDALAYLDAAPAAVDRHSADQILLPLALADGPSTYSVAEVTQHLLTNLTIVCRFLERELDCEGAEGQPGVVKIGA